MFNTRKILDRTASTLWQAASNGIVTYVQNRAQLEEKVQTQGSTLDDFKAYYHGTTRHNAAKIVKEVTQHPGQPLSEPPQQCFVKKNGQSANQFGAVQSNFYVTDNDQVASTFGDFAAQTESLMHQNNEDAPSDIGVPSTLKFYVPKDAKETHGDPSTFYTPEATDELERLARDGHLVVDLGASKGFKEQLKASTKVLTSHAFTDPDTEVFMMVKDSPGSAPRETVMTPQGLKMFEVQQQVNRKLRDDREQGQ